MTLPRPMAELTPRDVVRFRRFVRRGPKGCVVWTGAKTKQGYGRFRLRERVIKAHRIAFVIERGACPEGLILLHKCDRPSCVNAWHLKPGTVAQNNAERDAKGRGVTPAAPRIVRFQGWKASIAQHCARLGLLASTVYSRLARGWPVRRALSTPAKGRGQ